MSGDNGNGNAGAIMVAFVLGAIAGAATALLLAPASGEETRRVLADKAREGRDKAAEAAKQGKEFIERQKATLSEAVERQKTHVGEAIERGKEAYQRARGTEQQG